MCLCNRKDLNAMSKLLLVVFICVWHTYYVTACCKDKDSNYEIAWKGLKECKKCFLFNLLKPQEYRPYNGKFHSYKPYKSIQPKLPKFCGDADFDAPYLPPYSPLIFLLPGAASPPVPQSALTPLPNLSVQPLPQAPPPAFLPPSVVGLLPPPFEYLPPYSVPLPPPPPQTALLPPLPPPQTVLLPPPPPPSQTVYLTAPSPPPQTVFLPPPPPPQTALLPPPPPPSQTVYLPAPSPPPQTVLLPPPPPPPTCQSQPLQQVFYLPPQAPTCPQKQSPLLYLTNKKN